APVTVAGTLPPRGDAVRSPGPGGELLPNRPQLPAGDSGIAEAILPRFSPHEPIYFIAGPDRPNAKFQVSFKYQVFNPEGSWSQTFPPLSGLHLAYSQTSFWDWEGDSAPFFDNSYRPELLWSAKDWRLEDGGLVSRLGLQVGVNHESNGRDGPESRSLNVAYVRPSVTFGNPEGFFVTFAPKLYAYLDQADENKDIEDYRGYGDLRLIVGDRNGLQAAVIGRVGDDWDKGSVQLDLSYPTRKFFGGNVDMYLHAQVFSGYGESLLEYNRYSNRVRFGVSIVR
ncbi:MAG: phospholipase, partial [Phycisphaerales bacterium]|nr:phospholipase [Phycisphaerales bacterium]